MKFDRIGALLVVFLSVSAMIAGLCFFVFFGSTSFVSLFTDTLRDIFSHQIFIVQWCVFVFATYGAYMFMKLAWNKLFDALDELGVT